MSQKLEAGKLGQCQAEQDHVARVLLEEAKAADAVGRAKHQVTLVGQYLGGEPALPHVVVHDQRGTLGVARLHRAFPIGRVDSPRYGRAEGPHNLPSGGSEPRVLAVQSGPVKLRSLLAAWSSARARAPRVVLSGLQWSFVVRREDFDLIERTCPAARATAEPQHRAERHNTVNRIQRAVGQESHRVANWAIAILVRSRRPQ
jgi:hypothetical protein